MQAILEKKVQDRLVVINPKNKNEVHIIGSEEDFLTLSSKYDSLNLSVFDDLLFFIYMDLKYGLDKWGLVAEDEIIEVPNYPNIVTGEFINKDKNNPLIKKKIKKRAKENLKNLMNE